MTTFKPFKHGEKLMISTVADVHALLKPSSYFKRAVNEILALPKCEKTYGSYGYWIFKAPRFFIRVLEKEEYVQIQLAERKTFDRWANSVNFVTERSKERKCYYPLFRPQYKWAIQVLNTKLFNFNKYFAHIELPWFETGRNP